MSQDPRRVEEATEETRITAAPSGNASSPDAAPPPSYDSLYGRLKSVRTEASGPKDYVARSCGLLCASVVGTILLAPLLAIPIAMIAVGASHLSDCPAQRYIPIYLVVGGCFGVLQMLLTFSLRVKNHREEKGAAAAADSERQGEGSTDSNARPNPGSGIISCFLFAWFITGSVWVYGIYTTVNTTGSASSLPDYCHGGTYWFAFVLITLGYVAMALSCCCAVTCGILGAIFTKNN